MKSVPLIYLMKNLRSTISELFELTYLSLSPGINTSGTGWNSLKDNL